MRKRLEPGRGREPLLKRPLEWRWPMLDPKDLEQYTTPLFDAPGVAKRLARPITALRRARSARLSELAREPGGGYEAAYKEVQRFLGSSDPRRGLRRLFDPEAPFVIGDRTEIARPQAKRTGYVGVLKDGRTRGFNLLAPATPKRGRAVPFAFVSYGSATPAEESTSFAWAAARPGWWRPAVASRSGSGLYAGRRRSTGACSTGAA